FWPKSIPSEIDRAGNLDQRRRVKFHAGERSAQAKSVKKRLQIQAAARFEIGGVRLPVPISASGKTAIAIAPFAMCNVQVLIIPFGSGGQISHFVVAALQSVSLQRRLHARLFDFRDVSAEFQLQRWNSGAEPKLLQFIQHALRNQQMSLPFLG